MVEGLQHIHRGFERTELDESWGFAESEVYVDMTVMF